MATPAPVVNQYAQAKLVGLLPELITVKDFWLGLVLGAQEVKNDRETGCYSYAGDVFDFVTSTSLDFDDWAKSIKEKGNSATDMGFLIQSSETVNEFNLLYFNLYASCYFELIFIQMGKMFTDLPNAFDFIQLMLLDVVEYFSTGKGAFAQLDAVTDGTNVKFNDVKAKNQWFETIGKYLGVNTSRSFGFVIPVYEVDSFGKSG